MISVALAIAYHWVVEIGRTLFTRWYLLDELTTVDQLWEMECHPFPESSKSSKSSKSSSRKLHSFGSFWRGLEPDKKPCDAPTRWPLARCDFLPEVQCGAIQVVSLRIVVNENYDNLSYFIMMNDYDYDLWWYDDHYYCYLLSLYSWYTYRILQESGWRVYQDSAWLALDAFKHSWGRETGAALVVVSLSAAQDLGSIDAFHGDWK